MSRYVIIGAQELVTADGMRRRLHAGQTIADSTVNAQPGDVIAPSLCAQPNTRLTALDASAVAAFASMGITATIGRPLSGVSSGADSVDT